MNAYEKIRAALEQAYKERHEPCSVELRIDEALAALAELERSAAEPVATVLGIVVEWTGEQPPEAGTKLYAAPPAPVAAATQFVAGEVADEMCDSAYISKWRGVPGLIGHEPDDEDRQWSREWLEAWRAELGPTLGLVALKEPTPEECERICTEYERLLMREGTCGGRDAFDAVRAVMWPKEGL